MKKSNGDIEIKNSNFDSNETSLRRAHAIAITHTYLRSICPSDKGAYLDTDDETVLHTHSSPDTQPYLPANEQAQQGPNLFSDFSANCGANLCPLEETNRRTHYETEQIANCESILSSIERANSITYTCTN